jgi:PhnB protein
LFVVEQQGRQLAACFAAVATVRAPDRLHRVPEVAVEEAIGMWSARAALTFYHSVFGGQITVTTYGDFGMPAELPGATKVVFGQVAADNGFRLMACDVPGPDVPVAQGAPTTRREDGGTLTEEPFFLSVRGETVEEVGALWERLAEGATVIEAYARPSGRPPSGC